MRKRICVLLLCELTVLSSIIWFLITAKVDLHHHLPVLVTDFHSDYIVNTGSGWHVDSDQIHLGSESINLMYYPINKLEKGSYTVDIWYDCDTDQSAVPSAPQGYESLIDGREFVLDKNLTHESYSFRAKEAIESFTFIIKYNGKPLFY